MALKPRTRERLIRLAYFLASRGTDPRTPRLLQIQEQSNPEQGSDQPQFGLGRNDENGIYPWEICEIASGKVVVRASNEGAAKRCLAELNEKGFIEIDL